MNSTTSNHFPTANFSLRRDTSATSLSLAYAYYRLSQEEAQDGQSSASIINQRKIVEAYCAQRGIVLLDSFVDAAVIIGLKTLRLKKCQKHAAF